MKRVGVIGVGKYLPKKVLSNADLEKAVDTSDEWITTRTGIKERRLAAKTEATGDLALKAAKDALLDAKLNACDVELIIVATITPDMHFPATACLLQNSLAAKNAVCFDVAAACSGFIYAISIAQQFIARGTVCPFVGVVSRWWSGARSTTSSAHFSSLSRAARVRLSAAVIAPALTSRNPSVNKKSVIGFTLDPPRQRCQALPRRRRPIRNIRCDSGTGGVRHAARTFHASCRPDFHLGSDR